MPGFCTVCSAQNWWNSFELPTVPVGKGYRVRLDNVLKTWPHAENTCSPEHEVELAAAFLRIESVG